MSTPAFWTTVIGIGLLLLAADPGVAFIYVIVGFCAVSALG